MRILIIEDDFDMRQYLKESLRAEGFVVETAGDGAEGSYMARIHEYDLVLLDYIMPKKNGKEVLRDIRGSGKAMPILMLSVEGEIDDKVDMLSLGADDYMTKPFAYRELASRVRSLLRRPKQLLPTTLKVEDLTLDTVNQKARRGDRDIYLTRKEYAVTELLMRHSGNIVSRGMLMDHVWHSSIDPFSNTIETHMLNLRKKIDDGSATKLIETVPGRGYKINAHRKIFN